MAQTLDVFPSCFLSRQTTILTLIGPLFLQQKLLKLLRPKAKSGQRKLSAKGPPFIFYYFKETYKTGRAQRVPFGFFSAL